MCFHPLQGRLVSGQTVLEVPRGVATTETGTSREPAVAPTDRAQEGPGAQGVGPRRGPGQTKFGDLLIFFKPIWRTGTQKTPLKSSNHQFKVCSAWALGPGPRCFGACVVLVLWWGGPGGGARVARWRGGTVLGGSPNPLPRAFWAWTYVCPYTPGRSVA